VADGGNVLDTLFLELPLGSTGSGYRHIEQLRDTGSDGSCIGAAIAHRYVIGSNPRLLFAGPANGINAGFPVTRFVTSTASPTA
jgi:hypothetical protein